MQIRENVHDGKRIMSDYFKSSTDRAADKRASEVFTNKIHNEFSDVFQEKVALKEPAHYRSKKAFVCIRCPKEE